MKLQNMAIIFIIIILPISIVLSAYVKNEIKIIDMQNKYDEILISSTYDAVKALKINTNNNDFNSIDDVLRRDIKASVNTFIDSLASGLGVPNYAKESTKTHIPAVVYTLYDGFYIYSSTKELTTGSQYKHILKPRIYYSMKYDLSNNKYAIIQYTLDNYITVYLVDRDTTDQMQGYLVDLSKIDNVKLDNNNTYSNFTQIGENEKITSLEYNNEIIIDDEDALEYYKNAINFTIWVNEKLNGIENGMARKIGSDDTYDDFKNQHVKFLNFNSNNDPEDSTSAFNVHRLEVIRLSIQDNLNSAFVSYNSNSQTLGSIYNFKMPLFTAIEWERICQKPTVITFLQGFPLGNKYYNGYSIVSCNKINLKNYINKDEIYYLNENDNSDDNYYHKIDCPTLVDKNIEDYIGVRGVELERKIEGNLTDDRIYSYNEYHKLACYHCIIDSNYDTTELDKKINSQAQNDKDWIKAWKKIQLTSIAQLRKAGN